jgi:hypothetical protein
MKLATLFISSALVSKAETQGLEALTVAERSELRGLFERLEKLSTTPLNKLEGAKNSLRRDAQSRFYQQFHPELEAILRTDKGMLYDVHHCIPLEYAHRFPLKDINSEANLVAAAKPVHERINKVWMRFGSASRTPHENEILQVEEIVKKRFGRWFNKPYESSSSAQELAAAEAAAIKEVESLLARMR